MKHRVCVWGRVGGGRRVKMEGDGGVEGGNFPNNYIIHLLLLPVCGGEIEGETSECKWGGV